MERDELEQRRFNQEEIGELIETATRLDQLRHDGQGLSVEELRQVATELGISDEALLAAVHERMETERQGSEAASEQERQNSQQANAAQALQERRRSRLNEWKSDLATYVGVIAGLAAFDWFPDQSFDWVFWPAAGWGIWIVIDTIQVALGAEDEE
ncbi:MAG: 2TM domain-containing protein [Acidimicrobiia bacterium]